MDSLGVLMETQFQGGPGTVSHHYGAPLVGHIFDVKRHCFSSVTRLFFFFSYIFSLDWSSLKYSYSRFL